MEVFGFPISTIYIALLFISGIFVLLYALFGDIIEGLDEGIPFLQPNSNRFFRYFCFRHRIRIGNRNLLVKCHYFSNRSDRRVSSHHVFTLLFLLYR